MASQDYSPGSESFELALLHSDPALVQRGLEVIDVLGIGGNSIVYRAHDPRHGRDVAVKVLRSDATSDIASARFQREVRVAGGLRHRHILPLFDSGVLSDGRPFAVMPIAQGRPLRAMIDEGPLTIADTITLVCEIGEALTYLHARGWVHRDVKPENILVEGGHAVLTDFGIASRIESDDDLRAVLNPAAPDDPDSRITQTGRVVGTPVYMSPEALSGDGPLDARGDVYALGIVLGEMLTGSVSLKSRSASESWNASTTLPLRRRDVPAALATAASRATAPDRKERFATVQQFTEALRAVPTTTADDRASRRPDRRDLRNWLAAGLLAMAVVLGVLGVNWRHAALPDPQRVVVADFDNETGRPELEPLGEIAGDLVVAALSRTKGLTVINSAVALGARQRSPTPAADSILTASTLSLVRQTRAGIVVTGSYFADGTGLGVMAEVSDSRSGRVLGVVGPVAVDTTRTRNGFEAVGDSVASIVRHRYIPPDSVP